MGGDSLLEVFVASHENGENSSDSLVAVAPPSICFFAGLLLLLPAALPYSEVSTIFAEVWLRPCGFSVIATSLPHRLVVLFALLAALRLDGGLLLSLAPSPCSTAAGAVLGRATGADAATGSFHGNILMLFQPPPQPTGWDGATEGGFPKLCCY